MAKKAICWKFARVENTGYARSTMLVLTPGLEDGVFPRALSTQPATAM
ncbi:unnamed protein product [Chondrus crispus]|uniref:Uncharacterized protein n=1 Tax=Chondrus crispus TaxID=2769 RepID=R7Q8G0_CHOCR|nr:unnamed protein product [Chondrus crispus]CDF34319.1 unnamed protein product [Chondrus crispus]|eukprot:XP_005714138.1 unnamed protein product [Chondrus crispus]